MASPVPGKTAPRLFISYSHDSQEHEDQVRAIADRLRQDGIDAVIDQYDTAPSAGWPMWMDREIQKADFVALVCTETYLKRVEGRELPGKGRGVLWEANLIYNLRYREDTAVQRFIPILFKGETTDSIPLPLRGLTHYQVDTEEGYEDFYRHLTGQPRYEKAALGKLKSLPAIPPQSYPASLETPTEQKTPTSLDKRNRLQMLKRVRLDWINGVLKQSLYQVARIELGLQTKSDAVEQPLKAIIQTPGQPSKFIPPGTRISQIFDDHGSALLILGVPGMGKTTLLLELAEQLLDRAEKDEGHPMPVVFNLSSWAVRRRPLREWLISELNERSDVPKKVAQQWVETEQIIPLLDGLDEVAIEHREACAEAINDFRRDYGLLPMSVCSRIADYEVLGTKLRLRSAVVVQPLPKPEVQVYLERIGEPLDALRRALEKEPSFWDLLETPLMLWVAVLSYQGVPVEFSVADSFEQRRSRLFANFVDAMFKRRSAEVRYSPKQTLSWLCWLAAALKRNKQTVFYLENLTENWLPTRAQKWLPRAAIAIGSGLVGGLIFGSSDGQIGALLFGLVSSFMPIRPVETMRISSVGVSSRLPRAARTALIFGVVFGLIYVPVFGVLVGPALGLAIGIAFGLVPLLSSEAIESRSNPNQGVRCSMRASLAIGGIAGILVQLLGGSPDGLIMGFAFGGVGGGLFVLRHLSLRLILWRSQSIPLHYVRFLDYATERLFLRKVGGGYIFIHRMLLEYFASIQEQPQPEPKG
jgi:DNA polymerase III delta prime subunit